MRCREFRRHWRDTVIFENYNQLVSHGCRQGREMALDILDYCLKQVNAREATKRFVKLNGNLLQVGERTFDLAQIRHIYVVGSGKATFPLAVALEEILTDRITEGFISVKDGQITTRLSQIKVVEASHPYPDRRSYEAALENYVAIAQKAGEAGSGILFNVRRCFCIIRSAG